jgi:nucleotide-binding universal stress UspA family protein
VLPQTGVRVEKVAASGKNVLDAVLGFLDHHPYDLIVMSTRARSGLGRFLHPSVAASLAQRADAPSLLLPHGRRGFVSLETGELSLRRVLIPVSRKPRSEPAIQTVAGIASALGGEPPELVLVFAGDEAEMPATRVPDSTGLPWKRMARKGSPASVILEAAGELEADMIAMTTQGQVSLLDRVRGSTTERVLQGATCPVLAVPFG